eukprot:392728-Amphidinium_carterae.1
MIGTVEHLLGNPFNEVRVISRTWDACGSKCEVSERLNAGPDDAINILKLQSSLQGPGFELGC